MTAHTAQKTHNSSEKEVKGELTRRLTWAPLRALAILTGFFLLRGLASLVGRYCLTLRRRARIAVSGSSLVVDVEWSILGKSFRQIKIEAPIVDIRAIQMENRQRYLYLLFGFSALAVGAWLGIQWFVDGLRAGYPYLALIGAGVVVAGIAIDLGLYLFVPRGPGRSRLSVALGPWKMRISGVDDVAAEQLLADVRAGWNAKTAR